MNSENEKIEGGTSTKSDHSIICPQCKDPNPSNASFCKKCGSKLQQPEKANTQQNDPSVKQKATPPPPPIPPVTSQVKPPPPKPTYPKRDILVTNTETIVGKEIVEVLGLVQGNTVRAKHIGKDIVAQLKNIVGGEVTDYTRLFSEAREVAISRMIENAISVGADAVVNVRFVSSMISQGMSELLAYGTAVKLNKEKNEANK